MTRRALWFIAETSDLLLELQLFLFHPPNFQVVRSRSCNFFLDPTLQKLMFFCEFCEMSG